MPQAKSVREWLLQFDGQATLATPLHTLAPPLTHPCTSYTLHTALQAEKLATHLHPFTPYTPLHPFPPPSQAEKLVIPAMRRAMASGDGGGKKHAVGSGAYKSLV